MGKEPPQRFLDESSGHSTASGLGSRLFTIGHSNHEAEAFLALLRRAEIKAIADVRSSAASTRYPHFNRAELERFLKQKGITYLYLGDLLGGRPQGPSLYDENGRVDYERVRQMPFFEEGLGRVIKGQKQFRIALMCAEEDPLRCHRGLMIAPALVDRGFAPVHVRGDSTLESTAEMEKRLFKETKKAEFLDGLFATTFSDDERRAWLREAYHEMAERRAFRQRPDSATEADVRGEIDDFGE